MSDVVISIENISKKYRLGSIGTGTLRQDLQRWWSKVRGHEDPCSIVDENPLRYDGEEFWALQNISFEVRQGDAMGIIGKNGAGKSTLLKILSRITAPTSGEVKVVGRIASLLEVGTGFHPELTGRENIFLNGAILGMTKREIKKKLDEIISFSGVEQHIDTPVKRYSSGMYVRLAFAVAAHLEPEILIVDEVLAVGDAEFQKKCLGKMNQVAREGRTVLFVSHNMGAIKSLCNTGILLNAGKVYLEGSIDRIIATYGDLAFHDAKAEVAWDSFEEAPGNNEVRIVAVRILNKDNRVSNILPDNQDFYVEIDLLNTKGGSYLTSNIQLYSASGVFVLSTGNWASVTANVDPFSTREFEKGIYRSRVRIPAYFLNEGGYTINAIVNKNVSTVVCFVEEAVSFTIIDSGDMRKEYTDYLGGVVRPKLEWNTTPISKN